MRSLTQIFGVLSCSALLYASISSVALATDNIGETQPGKSINGKILKVDPTGVSQALDVTVKRHDTGEVVVLHIDKNTVLVDNYVRPIPGYNVMAKYNEMTYHAITFLTDQRSHN